MDKKRLLEELKANNVACDEQQADLLLSFMEETLSTNKKFNLTAIKDRNEFVEKMIFDSALPISCFDFTNKKGIDVGTGAGYPGMVLKILAPSMNLTLLDSTSKKINFINDFAKQNAISVSGVSARSEDFCKLHREEFDFATARAVANLSILLEIITPMLKVHGHFIALKGPGFEEEIKEASNALNKLSLKIKKVEEFELPESKEKRAIIIIEKLEVTKKKYPREYTDIKRQPL